MALFNFLFKKRRDEDSLASQFLRGVDRVVPGDQSGIVRRAENIQNRYSRPAPQPQRVAGLTPKQHFNAFGGAIGQTGQQISSGIRSGLIDPIGKLALPKEKEEKFLDFTKRYLPDPTTTRGKRIQKGVELGTLFAPGSAALKGTKILSKAARTPTVKGRVIRELGQGTGFTLGDVAQQRTKGEDVNLGKSLATGAGLDLATLGTGRVIRKASDALGVTNKLPKVTRRQDLPPVTVKGNLSDELRTSGRVNPKIQQAPIKSLKIGTDAISDGLDKKTVKDIQKALVKNRPIEPLVVRTKDGVSFVQDGAHRLKAAQKAGAKEVPVVEQIVKEIAQKPKVTPKLQDVADKPVKPSAASVTDMVGGSPRKLSLSQKLSPDRVIRERVSDPIGEKINKALYKAGTSDNVISRGVARAAQGISREAGVPKDLLAMRRKFFGQGELGRVTGKTVKDVTSGVPEASTRRIWATIDPEQASKIGATTDINSLTPNESRIRDEIIKSVDETTQGNLSRGLITPEQAAQPYLKRAYEPFEDLGEYQQTYNRVWKDVLGSLNSREKEIAKDLLDDAITDPGYLAGKRAAESHQAWAFADYSNWLADNGYLSTSARKGFVQLPSSKLHGKAAGMYAPKQIAEDFTGFQYSTSWANALNDAAGAYDRLGIRQFRKKMLTVYNPAVRLGNQFSNRIAFATLNGINPATFQKSFSDAGKLIKNKDPVYLEALRQGVMGTDITQAEFTRRVGEFATDRNILRQADDWLVNTYRGADDRAKLAAFKTHLDRGYSPDEAARLTQRGFQDYKSVGFFYDIAAKTPLIGNAFIRFSGDAMRIGKNALTDHPIRTVSLVLGWQTVTNMMSKFSDETEEDRATREERFGSPKVPFTDTSLSVQTPWGEVNVARFLPFYALNDVQGDVSRFLPFQESPIKDGKFNAGVLDDPLLGSLAQVAIDKDFRNKSIQDPENTEILSQGDFSVEKYTELPPKERKANLRRFLFNQFVPLGREVDAVSSAFKGEEDIFGKSRNPIQSLLRAGGVKVEQFGPEQAQKQRELNDFFEGNIARTKEFLDKNPDLTQGYFAYKNPTINRATGKKDSDVISPEKWTIVKGDTSGRLFDFLRQEALENAKKGQPSDPIFNLSPQQAKVAIELRSRPTGDDIETEEMLRASQPWYSKFEKAESEFYPASSKYFSELGLPDTQHPRSKEYGEVYDKFYPQQTPTIQQYYKIKNQNPDAAKEFYKANADQLSNDFNQYRAQRLAYINEKRRIEGYPPISIDEFNNVTFGYEADEDKVYRQLAFGRGGFGGGSRPFNPGSAFRFALNPVEGTEISSPRVENKKVTLKKIQRRKIAQPKVSIKRSKV